MPQWQYSVWVNSIKAKVKNLAAVCFVFLHGDRTLEHRNWEPVGDELSFFKPFFDTDSGKKFEVACYFWRNVQKIITVFAQVDRHNGLLSQIVWEFVG